MLTDPVHHDDRLHQHEGTTHLYRPGLRRSRRSRSPANYRNQVNIWTSQRRRRDVEARRLRSAGSRSRPDAEHRLQRPRPHAGRGRPDLQHRHQPRQRLAVLLRATAARRGTAAPRNCHDGDRPWLAGGKQGRGVPGHRTRRGHALATRSSSSTDGGNTCSPTGIPDAGTLPDGDAATRATASSSTTARATRSSSRSTSWTPTGTTTRHRRRHLEAAATRRSRRTRPSTRAMYAHWPAIALDDAGDAVPRLGRRPARRRARPAAATAPRRRLPNQIRMILLDATSARRGRRRVTIARPPARACCWPWVAAGDAGKVIVVWYQTDKVADLACQHAELLGDGGDGHRRRHRHAGGQRPSTPSAGRSPTTTSARTARPASPPARTAASATSSPTRSTSSGCVIIAHRRHVDQATRSPAASGRSRCRSSCARTSGAALRGGGDCSGRAASLLSNSHAQMRQPAVVQDPPAHQEGRPARARDGLRQRQARAHAEGQAAARRGRPARPAEGHVHGSRCRASRASSTASATCGPTTRACRSGPPKK